MFNKGRKHLKTILLATLIVGLVGATSAFAFKGMGGGMCCGMGDGGGMGHGRGMHMMMNLTPEQASQVFDLRQKFMNDTADLRKGMLIKSIELAHLWKAENPDEAAIQAKAKELAAVKAQFMEKAISQRLAMKKLVPNAPMGPGHHKMGPGQAPGKGEESSVAPGSDDMAGCDSGLDLGLALNEEPAW
jgi:Spy/CpxP family protein refolding chaperone